MKSMLVKHWYQQRLTWLTAILVPFAKLFAFIVHVRRLLFKWQILKSYQFHVPVIVVGNITAGGTGKTPLVIWIANLLREQGYHPGIVSRGVGSRAHDKPYHVTMSSSVEDSGDEPLLIAKNTNCPVVIYPDRVKAVAALLSAYKCNIIICDDGLQHYRLARDVEIAVVDGVRKFGNRQLLPAGPLRESCGRLNRVDFAVYNGVNDQYCMNVVSERLLPLNDGVPTRDITDFAGKTVHAVAGIGNPGRFYKLLNAMHIQVVEHPFPDHHHFKQSDMNFADDAPIVMTEKDAMKCKLLGIKNAWYLKVNVKPNKEFEEGLLGKIKNLETVYANQTTVKNIADSMGM